MGRIIDVVGREVIDSRGNPTVEVEVFSTPVPLAGPLYLLEHQPGYVKPSNFETLKRNGISAKVS